HAAVVFLFVMGFSMRGQPHHHVTRLDVVIGNHVTAFHAAGNRTVNDYGAHQITHVSGFSTGGENTNAHVPEFSKDLLRAVDDFDDHFAGDRVLVPPDGCGEQDGVSGPRAQQATQLHSEGIVRNSPPH